MMHSLRVLPFVCVLTLPESSAVYFFEMVNLYLVLFTKNELFFMVYRLKVIITVTPSVISERRPILNSDVFLLQISL
jgi:hypothetical protein